MNKEQTEQLRSIELRVFEEYKEFEHLCEEICRLTIDGTPTKETEFAKEALNSLEDATIAIRNLRSTFGDNYYLNLPPDEKERMKKNKARLKIKVARGVARKIANQFDCSDSKVHSALYFKGDSDTCRLIRETALKYFNGKIMRADSFLK